MGALKRISALKDWTLLFHVCLSAFIICRCWYQTTFG